MNIENQQAVTVAKPKLKDIPPEAQWCYPGDHPKPILAHTRRARTDGNSSTYADSELRTTRKNRKVGSQFDPASARASLLNPAAAISI